MDPEPAEPATSMPSRRSLIRAVGAAGVVGVAGAAAVWASGSGSAAPTAPTTADTALLEQAMLLELTARDLYREALGGLDGVGEDLLTVLQGNHGSYAESIAGAAGLSAAGRNETVFDALKDAFAEGDVLAAHTLEQTAVATHTELAAQYESVQAINLTASILVVEARHATVLADIAGVTDLDVIFGNEQSAVDLSEVVT